MIKRTPLKRYVIKDQEAFFDLYTEKKTNIVPKNFIQFYEVNHLLDCFTWIERRRKILDYGCGQGSTLDLFFDTRDTKEFDFFGVDISESQINVISKKYPDFKFYKITNNSIPQIPDSSMDGVCLNVVLHHTEDHESILKEIYIKLKPSGRFYVIDLSSNNPILKLGLCLFRFMPEFIKNKFSDDYVVNGKIPEKIKVSIEDTITLLNQVGFEIIETGYGHLFFMIFCWLDRFIPFSKIGFILIVYKKIIALEQYLLKFKFFQKRAEVFFIKCKKN